LHRKRLRPEQRRPKAQSALRSHSPRRRSWSSRRLCSSERSRSLAGPRPTTAYNRWKAAPAGDQQAREHLSADAPDPWRQGCTTQPCQSDTTLGSWLRGLQTRCHPNTVGRSRQQAGEDRLGSHPARDPVLGSTNSDRLRRSVSGMIAA
jgi:hypothetical protein